MGVRLQSETSQGVAFSDFVRRHEADIRRALVAYFGSDLGRDAAAQALLYGLENWDRIGSMVNPSGYLYRVGQRWGLRQKRPRVSFGIVSSSEDLWFEPGLRPALERLPDKQRVAVVLRCGADMDYAEIARLTGASESGVRKSVERGLASLRKALEVGVE